MLVDIGNIEFLGPLKFVASKVLSEGKLQSMEKENPLSLLVVANDFHQIYDSHKQKNVRKWIDVKDNPDEKKKQFDDFLGFDESVTLLSQYPEILRRLGLVVDLMIPFREDSTIGVKIASLFGVDIYCFRFANERVCQTRAVELSTYLMKLKNISHVHLIHPRKVRRLLMEC